MAFQEIEPREIQGNPFSMIADEWMLVAAGDRRKFNMMTASWGFLGEMWGADCAVAMVRPQRYTMEFLEAQSHFSLSFYGGRKEIHKICGGQSGRDVDKAAATGLIPVFSDGTVYFDQARLVLICRKLYVQDLKETCFVDREPLRWYDGDYHKMFIGRIEKVLQAV